MTGAALAALGAAGILALGDWVAVARSHKALEYVFKPAVMSALIAVALTLTPTNPTRRGWFVVALVFCAAGDVLLMVPPDLFVAGLGSFLLGHLAYVVGLTRHGGSAADLAVAAAVLVAVGAVLGSRILPAVRQQAPELFAPVSVYMVVITAMVAAAAATGDVVAVTGAGLFYVSDASIAWDRFVRPWPWARTWVIVTYHLGQAGLVLSLAR